VEELLKGQKPSEKLAKAAAELAVKDAAGIGHNEYKVDEVKTFVSRLVASMK
jgi:CO/xanthine dehydrogenase FAD-binding subunit